MKRGVMFSALLMVLVSFSSAGAADKVIRGKVILIGSDMYTIKTESAQGFESSRETFYIDSKRTIKTGDIKVGSVVEAEVNLNGTATWVKVIEESAKATGK